MPQNSSNPSYKGYIDGTFSSIGALYHQKLNIFYISQHPLISRYVRGGVKIEENLAWKCKIEASNNLKSSKKGQIEENTYI